MENINEQHAPIDTYLSKDTATSTSSFILPPMEPFGNSFAFHFDNASIGRNKTENEINSLAVYPIFYNYLHAFKIQTNENKSSGLVDISSLNVTHPNESLYIISKLPRTTNQEPRTLVLSQAYNPGWHAYEIQNTKYKILNTMRVAFPFIFGKEIKQHVMVNNWQNGWILDNQEPRTKNQELIIVYLPQYLEYFGFFLLFITPVMILIMPKIRRIRFDK